MSPYDRYGDPAPRPCLDCGEPAEATRCPACQVERDRAVDAVRGTTAERGYGARWQRLSRRARRLQPWCSDCGSRDELTGDHLQWPATKLEHVDVVCVACNSRRGALRSATARGEPRDAALPDPRARHDFGYTPPRGAS